MFYSTGHSNDLSPVVFGIHSVRGVQWNHITIYSQYLVSILGKGERVLILLRLGDCSVLSKCIEIFLCKGTPK